MASTPVPPTLKRHTSKFQCLPPLLCISACFPSRGGLRHTLLALALL